MQSLFVELLLQRPNTLQRSVSLVNWIGKEEEKRSVGTFCFPLASERRSIRNRTEKGVRVIARLHSIAAERVANLSLTRYDCRGF